jgi:hypothetical protein
LDVAQQALNVVPVSSLDITAINGTREVLKYVEGVAQILDAPAVDHHPVENSLRPRQTGVRSITASISLRNARGLLVKLL